MKILFLLVLSALCVTAEVFAEPVVITPANAQLANVSENINQDGMLLNIQTFYSDDSVENVMSFYRENWFTDGDLPGFVENTLGEWTIISQLRDNSNVVLQLKASENNGSEGFLSTAKINHGVSPPSTDFPTPDGTETFSSSYVEENDTQVHTMTFLSTQSVGKTVSFYRASLARKGWTLARDQAVEGNQVMLFNRNGDRCELVVSQFDSESTVIHVNRVKING